MRHLTGRSPRKFLGCLGATLVVVIANCATPMTQLHSTSFRSLAKGTYSGISKPTNMVVRTEADWKALWDQHAAPQRPPPARPEVDFDKEMVLAALMGEKRTGGYRIEITGVQEQEDRLIVRLKEQSPPKGSFTIQSLTAPFHFVALPKTKLKPVFKPGS